jgi:hypothetical protein
MTASVEIKNPVVDDQDGKWYWRGQIFDVHGPFDTEKAAQEDLDDYVLNRFKYEDRF